MSNEVQILELPSELETSAQRREFLVSLEDAIFECPNAIVGDSDELPLTHQFATGCYVRTIRIPAGTLLTGKIHKHEHPNMLMQGDISMITEDGGAIRMRAPQVLISPAGCKRAIFTHTDTIWTTIHVTDKIGLVEIEAETVFNKYVDYIEFVNKEG